MRKFMSASLLSLVLACSVYAGDIPFDYTSNSPNGATGEIPYGATGEIPFDATAEITLTIITSVLNLS